MVSSKIQLCLFLLHAFMTLMHVIPQMDHMHETILIPTCSQGSVIASGLLKCLVGMISLIQLTWYDIDAVGLQGP